MSLAAIGNPSYISVRTFRRSGVAVDTPVWVAADGGRLYVMTSVTTGKARRIRNNALVEVCASDMRGRPKGAWVPGQARIVSDPAEAAAGFARLKRKYGLQYRLAGLANRRHANDTMLEIADRE